MKIMRSLLFLVVSLVNFNSFLAAAAAKTPVASRANRFNKVESTTVKSPVKKPIAVQPKAPVAKAPTAKATITKARAAKPARRPVVQEKQEDVPAIPVSVQDAIPYLKNIENAPFSARQAQVLGIAWAVLYELFQSNNSSSPAEELTPQQIVAMAPLFEMNCLGTMEEYLDPKVFPKLSNDPESELHTNYATDHLRKTVGRLGSVFGIDYNGGAPKTIFEGDSRDLGVIVNVQNNTKSQFSIHQTSLDGKSTSHIGQLNPGLNPVNLHTAALQAPATAATVGKVTSSAYSFNFHEIGSMTPANISVRMMSGTELVKFLRTLPRDKKAVARDTFEMNGLPTSPEYLAEPTDWYLVLIQNPTPATSEHRNPDQRVQAVNVSKLTGPYLLTMQINDHDIEMKGSDAVDGSKRTIYQPSFTVVQIMQNQTMPALDIPLLILPQFLWNLPMMQTLWMLMSTTMLATQTGGKFFGKDSFGDSFEYFKNLSCFNNQSRYTFFIDLYNVAMLGAVLYNATWLMANALYEADLSSCSDIPQIYSCQNPQGHLVVNENSFYYINFIAMFIPKVNQVVSQKMFNAEGFNAVFAYPLDQLYSFIINALVSDIKEGIFGSVTETEIGVYRLTWRNKKNKVLGSQVLYLYAPISNVQIAFVNQAPNWVGTAVPTQLIQLTPGKTTEFKVVYEYSAINNKHILLAQETSPIDKLEVILPMHFSEYPIRELYLDIFNIFNAKPYTRCFIVKDSILPEKLITLTEQDWQSGIYLIPIVKNNEKITPINPGALTVVFYKADKTYLGEMVTSGQFNNTLETGIKEPARAYNIVNTDTSRLKDMYLSTGILLRYNQ